MDFVREFKSIYCKEGLKIYSISSEITYIEPLIPLTIEQEKCLREGDGQSDPNEYKQVNSSTGLAVNYFKLLEHTGKIENLVFEDKVARPLGGRGGRYANLDVSYFRDEKKYYVESKFLEPYYSGNEVNRDSYFKRERYEGIPENQRESWKKLFEDAQGYRLYNFSQLCRHLMAIWRKHHDDINQEFVLQSVTWKMSDSFIKGIEDSETQESFRTRMRIIEEEAESCEKRINAFLKEIQFNNIKFECKHYNDMLEDIKQTPFYEEFIKRYCLVD